MFYRHHIFFCTNERPDGHERGCCQNHGALGKRNYLKVRVKELGLEDVRVNTSGCLDRCELGPVMVVYPEGIWYNYQSNEDIDLILEKHIKGGEVVEKLQLKDDQKSLL